MIGMFRRWRWLILLLILGLVLRLVGFGQVPVSPYWDEMAIWDDARSIAETGADMHNRSWFQPLFISYGDYKLSVYIWFTALSSWLLPGILTAVRLPSLLAGLSLIPGVYFLVRFLPSSRKANHLPALLAAATAAILPWSLHFSRVGFEGHLGSAWLLWSVVALWHSFRSADRKIQILSLLGSVLLGTAAVYTYFSVRFVFPVIFLSPLFLWWPKWRQRWLQIFLAFGLWLILLVPMLKADFYDASNQYRLSAASILNYPGQADEINLWRQRSGNSLVSRVIFNRSSFLARDLARNYWAFLDPDYLFLTGDQNVRHSSQHTGLMFLSLAPFFLAGIVVTIRRSPHLAAYLGLWWAAGVLPAAVPTDVPHALRSLNALPVFTIFIALGLHEVWLWLSGFRRRFLGRWGKYALSGLFLLVLALEILRYQHGWLTTYPTASGQKWQDGYLQSARYISQQRDRYTFVYVDLSDDRYFLYYLPFSGLSWSQIQQMPSNNFRRSIFHNVIIDRINDWNTLKPNSLVVTTPSRLPAGWVPVATILGAAGKETYVAVETPRD